PTRLLRDGVSRAAIVAVGTRNSRAMSDVDTPITIRSVSAAAFSRDSAGGAQSMTSRRRSSRTGSPAPPITRSAPSWDPPSTARTAAAPRSARPAWRPGTCAASAATASAGSGSRTRRRALVSSHAGGFVGTPSRGQVRAAASKASARPSSARSSRRYCATSSAVSRPQWSRQASSSARSASSAVISLDLDDRPYLDRVAVREQPHQVERGLLGVDIDQVEAAQLLGDLGVRPLGDQPLGATPRLQRHRLLRERQGLAAEHLAALAHRAVERPVPLEDLVTVRLRGAVPGLRVLLGHQYDELHRSRPLVLGVCHRLSLR